MGLCAEVLVVGAEADLPRFDVVAEPVFAVGQLAELPTDELWDTGCTE